MCLGWWTSRTRSPLRHRPKEKSLAGRRAEKERRKQRGDPDQAEVTVAEEKKGGQRKEGRKGLLAVKGTEGEIGKGGVKDPRNQPSRLEANPPESHVNLAIRPLSVEKEVGGVPQLCRTIPGGHTAQTRE